MTGSSPTASIANTFDRPNPSSLATSPAFSINGSMAGPPSSALDFPSIGRSMSWGKNTEHWRDRFTFTSCFGRESLLWTITQVIAQTTAARSPGCCTSLITSPSVKGPFRRRFRRMSFARA
jgi:hypothetical protein